MSKKLRHRGPDWSGIHVHRNAILAHERLSIVDPTSGRQPLFSPSGDIVLAVNGEIYNHQNIREDFEPSYSFRTKSDYNRSMESTSYQFLDFCRTELP